MNIFHRVKNAEIPTIDKGARVEMYLDESTVRMCMKYRINAAEFMKNALLTEIHNQAIIRESTCFNGGKGFD